MPRFFFNFRISVIEYHTHDFQLSTRKKRKNRKAQHLRERRPLDTARSVNGFSDFCTPIFYPRKKQQQQKYIDRTYCESNTEGNGPDVSYQPEMACCRRVE
ncbi:hypothetical protein OUZ56_014957 [Daphnia magna]|uniref:Uncharacterized protein n=1 Tax=Daphnia magna TaxID=35525 RepID=A0ABR0ALC9_9CRUS|nr:hypothetical protein OUZ56_014957 [Daphnia magna]